MSLADEIADGLSTVSHALAGLLGADLAPMLAERASVAAERIAAELQHPDPSIAAQTAVDLIAVLWSGDPDPRWWTTSLGAALARAGHDEPVTFGEAAAILGRTRGTVSQLVARGILRRHPASGLSRVSVVDYGRRRHKG